MRFADHFLHPDTLNSSGFFLKQKAKPQAQEKDISSGFLLKFEPFWAIFYRFQRLFCEP